MFEDFLNLLSCYHSDQILTEDFLIREYTRIGFNKTLTVIKLAHFWTYLCDSPSSRFYIISTVLPPKLKTETNILITLGDEEEMINFYRESYEEYLNENKQKAQEIT